MPTSTVVASALLSHQSSENQTERCVRVCIVGGQQIMRSGIAVLLQQRGCESDSDYHYCDEESFEQALDEFAYRELPYDLVVLILTGGPFTVIHRISEVLGQHPHDLPLLVLSDKVTRGHVYAALRIGAKGYLELDAKPEELAKAVHSAANNKVFLSPEVTELLVDDVSSSYESKRSQRVGNTRLSIRETEIVQLLCESLSSKEIARKLHLSPKTIENHRYNIYRKCSVESVTGLMRYAIQNGMVVI